MSIGELVPRVRGLLLTPREEIARAAPEPGDLREILPYVLPLIAVGPVARMIGTGVVGLAFGGGGFVAARLALALVGGVMSLVVGLAGFWLVSFLLAALAPSFGGRKDIAGARKAAAFASTPVWVAASLGILSGVPLLGSLAVLPMIAALVYGVVIGMWAVPAFMGTPPPKALGHVLVAMAVAAAAVGVMFFVLFTVVIGALFAAMIGISTHAAGNGAPGPGGPFVIPTASPTRGVEIGRPRPSRVTPNTPSAPCITVPEHATGTLSCPSGTRITAIRFASYGTPIGTCGAFELGSCDAPATVPIVSRACVGQTSCSVSATNETFGDPCEGTRKQLSVHVDCE